MVVSRNGADKKQREPFWKSLAGILAAVAAMITALVGVASLVYQIGGFKPASNADLGPSPEITSANTSIHPRAATSASASHDDIPSAGPYELLFNNNGDDLDADPPRVATGPDTSIDIYDGGGSIQSYPIWSGLAKWTRPGKPSRNDCIAAINSFASMSFTYIKGSRYCVHTRGERHIAFIEFVAPEGDGWRIRVVTWPGTAV